MKFDVAKIPVSLQDPSPAFEEKLNNLTNMLAEYTYLHFQEQWVWKKYKQKPEQPITYLFPASLPDQTGGKLNELSTKKENMKATAFQNVPGGWALIRDRFEKKVDPTIVLADYLIPAPNLLRGWCRDRAREVMTELIDDPKATFHDTLKLYFGEFYDEAKIKGFIDFSINAVTVPLADKSGVERGYSYWNKGVSLKFDTTWLTDLTKTYFQYEKDLTLALGIDGASRTRALTQLSDWYKDNVLNDSVKTAVTNIHNGLNSFANAIDATKYGAEIKGIMCAPITGKANFTETVANALSKLRAEAPVFAHDKEAYSACLLLVAFSSDISGSLILSVAVVAMLCGFGGFNLDEIMENLGQPGFSRIMPQAQELFSAGAAFPTEINSLIKDTGFEGIEWNQPVLDVFGQWLDKNTKPYQDLGNQFLEEVNNIVAIPSIAADKISNVLTDMANKNDNPQNALASGVDKGTKDPKKIPPFDHWFSILSLAALLGQFNDVLKLGAEAGASLLKEADNLLGTAEKMADAPLAVIQNLQKISADVENINDTRLKVMGGAVELIKQLTSGISSPQFGALMVPLVKGGTEKLRQVLNEMVLNDPNAPEELNAPYGIIFPVMIVGSSTLQAPVELFYKALVSMFNITEITKP